MNYKFDDEIIHNEKAMWDLACSFMCHYNFLKEQIENAKEPYTSISHKGKFVMRMDKDYKKILSDYKKELKFMNERLAFILKKKNSILQKYITTES